jgi:7,8-dihydroneopterin aldolase/epimerase/oxygenase
MTSGADRAFARPGMGAELVSARDEIVLQGLECYGFHGVHPEEQTLGQRFVVDIRVTVDLRIASLTDDPADTVSYSDLARIARDIVEGPPARLIERVAGEIARAIGRDFPMVQAAAVTVRKPSAPIRGLVFEYPAVTINWTRGEDE